MPKPDTLPTPCTAASAESIGFDRLLRAPAGRVNVRASFLQGEDVLTCTWDVDQARMTPQAVTALGAKFLRGENG